MQSQQLRVLTEEISAELNRLLLVEFFPIESQRPRTLSHPPPARRASPLFGGGATRMAMAAAAARNLSMRTEGKSI
jgi:hypothetical protein